LLVSGTAVLNLDRYGLLAKNEAGELSLCREVGGNWRSGDLQRGDVIASRSKVNALNGWLLGECLPTVNLAHGDLTGCQECPEQHRRRLRRRQHGLRLDTAFELLVQSLDGIGGACRPPLTLWQPGEGELPITGFLQAVGNGTTFQSPLANE
jgi:hypothetical protein